LTENVVIQPANRMILIICMCFTAYARLNIRVAKANGFHGYDYARISLISPSNESVSDPFFTYSKPFVSRWTQFHLQSSLVKLQPGDNSFKIADETVEIFLPPEDEGVELFIFGDPCVERTNVMVFSCWTGYDLKTKLPELFKKMSNSVSGFIILGDNFYDRYGNLTESVYSNMATSRFLITTPGNHDYWALGDPHVGISNDQYAYGFLQYYGQDTLQSTKDPVNYLNFSLLPPESLPAYGNFFQFFKYGNLGFIVFSGAHTFEEQQTSFLEACEYFDHTRPAFVYLVTHWAKGLDGGLLTGPGAIPKVRALPGCSKVEYMAGHWHDNYNTTDGIVLGGFGMAINRPLTIPVGGVYLSTKNGRHIQAYFDLMHYETFSLVDNFDKIMDCIVANGASSCLHLATIWKNTTLVM